MESSTQENGINGHAEAPQPNNQKVILTTLSSIRIQVQDNHYDGPADLDQLESKFQERYTIYNEDE